MWTMKTDLAIRSTIMAALAAVLCWSAGSRPAAAQETSASVTVADVTAEEGDGNTFTFTLDNAVDGGFQLSITLKSRIARDTSFGTASSNDLRSSGDGKRTISFAGTSGEIQTHTVGTIEDDIWEEDETFTVGMALKTGAADVDLDVSDTAVGTIVNDDMGVLEIRDLGVTVEGSTHRFEVALTKSVPRDVDVTVRFEDGSATGGIDYDDTPRVVSFDGPDDLPSFESEHIKPFDVEYFEDDIVEPSEDFNIILEASVDDIDDSARSVGVILDDDEARISTSTRSTGTREGEAMVIDLTLDKATYRAFSVATSFIDGSATGGVDYDDAPDTLYFDGMAGETQSLTVDIFADDLSEGVENFGVSWTPSQTFIKPIAQTLGTILDNGLSSLTLSGDVTVNEGEDMVFTAVLGGSHSGGFTATTSYANLNASTSGDDYDDSPQTLNFAGTSGETQRFTVTTVDDAISEDDQAFRVSLSVDGNAIDDAVGTIMDDDGAPGLVFSRTQVPVVEGSTATYTVALETEPAGNVTVTLTGAGAGVGADPTSLVFTTANWNTAQTVTVTAGQDANTVSESVTLTHTAAGGGYGGVTGDVMVTTTDDDTPGLVFSRTQVPVVEGSTTTYTVALETEPTGNVTVTLTGAGSGIGANPTSLVFTMANWNTARVVTVSAGEDANTVSESVTLTHTATGGGYGGVTGDVMVTTTDDDTPGLVFSRTQVPVVEGSNTGYTVALATEPGGNVTVTLTGAGSGVGADPTSLVFTTANWNTARTVTVTAGQDANTRRRK